MRNGMPMRRAAVALVATSMGAFALGATALAQPNLGGPPDPEQERARAELERAQREAEAEQERARAELERAERAAEAEQERARVERERAQQQSELERSRNELQRAQRELERAAREVARLSAEAVGPALSELRRDWFSAGSRAVLGLSIEDVEIGVRVTGVSPGGAAEAAGVMTGDVIVAIDGAALTGDSDTSPTGVLMGAMRNVEPGETVTLRVQRAGTERDIAITAREVEGPWFSYDGPAFEVPRFPGFERFRALTRWQDMELVTLSPELGQYFGTTEGLLVVHAPEDSTLPLRDGDVILAIGDRMPMSPEHAIRILRSFEPGETLRLTVMRERMRETLEVQLPQDTGGNRDGAFRPRNSNPPGAPRGAQPPAVPAPAPQAPTPQVPGAQSPGAQAPGTSPVSPQGRAL